MKTFKIPLVWQMYGTVTVDAKTLEEAKEKALGPDAPLPDGYYLDSSCEIDEAALETMQEAEQQRIKRILEKNKGK